MRLMRIKILLWLLICFFNLRMTAGETAKSSEGELDKWRNVAITGVENYVYSDEITGLMLSLQWTDGSKHPLAYLYNRSGLCSVGKAFIHNDTLDIMYHYHIYNEDENTNMVPIKEEYKYLICDRGLIGISSGNGVQSMKDLTVRSEADDSLKPINLAGTRMFKYRYPKKIQCGDNRLLMGVNKGVPERLSVISKRFLRELPEMIVKDNYGDDESVRSVGARIASLLDLGINEGIDMSLDVNTRIEIADSLKKHAIDISVPDLQLLYLSGLLYDLIDSRLPFLNSRHLYDVMYTKLEIPADKWCEELAGNLLRGVNVESELSRMLACINEYFAKRLSNYYSNGMDICPAERKVIELVSNSIVSVVDPFYYNESDENRNYAIAKYVFEQNINNIIPERLRAIVFFSYITQKINGFFDNMLFKKEISFADWLNLHNSIVSPMTDVVTQIIKESLPIPY